MASAAAYNNAAQNDGGLVIVMTGLNRVLSLDPETGVVVCEAGVSLDQLMRTALPPAGSSRSPQGPRQVTIGGAIAADVHGKNHHRAGSFASHVHWFDLLLPGGGNGACRADPIPTCSGQRPAAWG